MNVSLLTAFPQLFSSFIDTSLVHKARQKGLVSFDLVSYMSFVSPKERIDTPTFGHGAGMLIKPSVVEAAIAAQEAKHGRAFRIFFSPQGRKLDQALLQELAPRLSGHVMCVCARYEGMDSRVEQEYADLVLSIGDYVLMGGELPAMVFLEGVLRYVPGVIGRAESVEKDSFTGPFLDHPEYTEPVVWKGKSVPDVIRSGNHKAIALWQQEQAVRKTVLERFDWLRSSSLTQEQRDVVVKHLPRHYVALMHTQVLLKDRAVPGTTSVTSIDIHDIARSSCTYGIAQYFIVTPLEDQQAIVQTLLDFWKTGVGATYNPERSISIERVSLQASLAYCIAEIEKQEGMAPVIVTTSAKRYEHTITYNDQERVWRHGRPVLFLFGTGRGLSEQLMEQADFVLEPVEGLKDFNHLSVRSAVAIILDRWLGLQPREKGLE